MGPGSGMIHDDLDLSGGPALGDAPPAYHRPMAFDLVRTTYGAAALDVLAAAVARAKGDEPLRPVTVVVPSNYAGVAARRALARRHGVIGVAVRDPVPAGRAARRADAGAVRPGARLLARGGDGVPGRPGRGPGPVRTRRRPAVDGRGAAAGPPRAAGPGRPAAPSPGPERRTGRGGGGDRRAGHRAAPDPLARRDRPDGDRSRARPERDAAVDVGPLVVHLPQEVSSSAARLLQAVADARAGHGDRRGHRAGRRTRGASPRPARPRPGNCPLRRAPAGLPRRTVRRADGRGRRGRRGPHRPAPCRRGGRGRRRPGADRHRPRATGAVRPAAVRAPDGGPAALERDHRVVGDGAGGRPHAARSARPRRCGAPPAGRVRAAGLGAPVPSPAGGGLGTAVPAGPGRGRPAPVGRAAGGAGGGSASPSATPAATRRPGGTRRPSGPTSCAPSSRTWPSGSSRRRQPTWAAHARWASRLLELVIGGPAQQARWSPEEQRAVERVERVLDRLARLDGVADDVEGDGVDRSVFRAALDAELADGPATVGRLGEGIFVGPIPLAVGIDADLVIVLGLVEGGLPGGLGDDPLALGPHPPHARRRADHRGRAPRDASTTSSWPSPAPPSGPSWPAVRSPTCAPGAPATRRAGCPGWSGRPRPAPSATPRSTTACVTACLPPASRRPA